MRHLEVFLMIGEIFKNKCFFLISGTEALSTERVYSNPVTPILILVTYFVP